MVDAYFVSWGCYGFWPPNDPRGSWSQTVRAPHLRQFGAAATVNTSQSLAHNTHDRSLRWRIKEALKYPAVTFTPAQVQIVGQGFSEAVQRTGCIIHACAIMPDHVHIVVARHRYSIEQLVIQLKGGASDCLRRNQLHPLENHISSDGTLPKMWEKGSWNVFLNGSTQIMEKIDYTNRNPPRAGLPRQDWDFITPYKSK